MSTEPYDVVAIIDPHTGRIVQVNYSHTLPGVGVFRWDVGRAIMEVHQGETIACVPIDGEQQRMIAARNEIDPVKVASPVIDISIPGIAAPFVDDNVCIYILIDGLHRNAKALRQGKPFHAHLLTDAAARRCYMGGPAGYMPWDYRPSEIVRR